MTRHRMIQTSAAGVTLPATDPHASVVIIVADRVPASLVAGRQNPVDAQRSGPSLSLIPCLAAIVLSRT